MLPSITKEYLKSFSSTTLNTTAEIIDLIRLTTTKDKKSTSGFPWHSYPVLVSEFMSPPCRLQWCNFCSWHVSITSPGKGEGICSTSERRQVRWNYTVRPDWPIGCPLNPPDLSQDRSYAVYIQPGCRIKQQLQALSWLSLRHPRCCSKVAWG